MIGWILVILGMPFAAANWYSPVSEAISGRHSSMVPPLGGILIGAGIFLISGSWAWSSLAIVLDPGLLWVLLAFPWLMYEAYSESSLALRHELLARELSVRPGRKATLKLFKNSRARVILVIGDTTYGLAGKWSCTENGYQVTYLEDRVCLLTSEGEHLLATESQPADEENPQLNLNGLTFRSVGKA